MRNYFVTLVCAAALLGCNKDKKDAGGGSASGTASGSAGSGGSAASGTASGGGGATAPTDKAGLTVLDQGAEPRSKLEYKIPPGTKQSFALSVDMGMDMGSAMGGKMKLPSMVMEGEVGFDQAAAGGGMPYKLTTSKLEFVDTPGAAVPAAMINDKLKGVQNMVATGTLAPNGHVSDFKIDMAGAPPEVQQTLSGLKQSYDQMVTQLPDQPIGKGGRWQVVQQIDENGIKAQQTAVFEVVSIDGSTVKLKSTVALTAPSQTINSNGISADLKRMAGTGSADLTLDLTKLVGPTTMTLHIDEELAAQGQSLSMSMDMAMKMDPK